MFLTALVNLTALVSCKQFKVFTKSHNQGFHTVMPQTSLPFEATNTLVLIFDAGLFLFFSDATPT